MTHLAPHTPDSGLRTLHAPPPDTGRENFHMVHQEQARRRPLCALDTGVWRSV